MLKKTLIAATILFTAATALQPVEKAEARVNFDVSIGFPGAYYPAPYYAGGYYGGGYYVAPRHRSRRVSCARGKRIVRNHGYRNVRAVDCRGSVYKFEGRRWGNWYLLKMKSRTGRIYRRIHI